jgi:hypothetical protein
MGDEGQREERGVAPHLRRLPRHRGGRAGRDGVVFGQRDLHGQSLHHQSQVAQEEKLNLQQNTIIIYRMLVFQEFNALLMHIDDRLSLSAHVFYPLNVPMHNISTEESQVQLTR